MRAPPTGHHNELTDSNSNSGCGGVGEFVSHWLPTDTFCLRDHVSCVPAQLLPTQPRVLCTCAVTCSLCGGLPQVPSVPCINLYFATPNRFLIHLPLPSFCCNMYWCMLAYYSYYVCPRMRLTPTTAQGNPPNKAHATEHAWVSSWQRNDFCTECYMNNSKCRGPNGEVMMDKFWEPVTLSVPKETTPTICRGKI